MNFIPDIGIGDIVEISYKKNGKSVSSVGYVLGLRNCREGWFRTYRILKISMDNPYTSIISRKRIYNIPDKNLEYIKILRKYKKS